MQNITCTWLYAIIKLLCDTTQDDNSQLSDTEAAIAILSTLAVMGK